MEESKENFFIRVKLFLQKNFWLVLILLVGFAVRFYGIYFDYPFGVTSIWEEPHSMIHLINMIEQRRLLTGTYSYGLLLPLLYIPGLVLRVIYLALAHGLYSVAALKTFLITNGMGHIYIVGRWYGVMFGTASIFLVYKISERIFKNRTSAYYAALVHSFSLIPVFLFHWGKLHGPMTFFLLLSFYCALIFDQTKKNKYLYLSSLFAAFSFALHYTGIASIIFPLYAFYINKEGLNFKEFFKAASVFIVSTATLYLANLPGVIKYVKDTYEFYYSKTGLAGVYKVSLIERLTYVFRDTFKVEPIFFIIFFIVLALGFRKIKDKREEKFLLIGVLFSFILLITIIVGPHMTRWLVIFIVLVTIYAGGKIPVYLAEKNISAPLKYLILAALLIPNIVFAVKWDSLLNKNTNNEAVAWLQGNLKGDESAYSFDNFIDPPLTLQAVIWNLDNNQRSASKKANFIKDNAVDFNKLPGINMLYDYDHQRYKELAGPKTKYLLFYYWQSGEDPNYRYDITTKKDTAEKINQVKKYHNLESVKNFYPSADQDIIKQGIDDYTNNPLSWAELWKLDKSGPFIEIYKVIN